MIKEYQKKSATPITNPDTGLKVKKNIFMSVPCVPGPSEEFRRIYLQSSVQVIFKGTNILKTILLHPKDKLPSQLKHCLQMVLSRKKIATFLTLENPADVWKIE